VVTLTVFREDSARLYLPCRRIKGSFILKLDGWKEVISCNKVGVTQTPNTPLVALLLRSVKFACSPDAIEGTYNQILLFLSIQKRKKKPPSNCDVANFEEHLIMGLTLKYRAYMYEVEMYSFPILPR
jgi:hypothetical protein